MCLSWKWFMWQFFFVSPLLFVRFLSISLRLLVSPFCSAVCVCAAYSLSFNFDRFGITRKCALRCVFWVQRLKYFVFFIPCVSCFDTLRLTIVVFFHLHDKKNVDFVGHCCCCFELVCRGFLFNSDKLICAQVWKCAYFSEIFPNMALHQCIKAVELVSLSRFSL